MEETISILRVEKNSIQHDLENTLMVYQNSDDEDDEKEDDLFKELQILDIDKIINDGIELIQTFDQKKESKVD